MSDYRELFHEERARLVREASHYGVDTDQMSLDEIRWAIDVAKVRLEPCRGCGSEGEREHPTTCDRCVETERVEYERRIAAQQAIDEARDRRRALEARSPAWETDRLGCVEKVGVVEREIRETFC